MPQRWMAPTGTRPSQIDPGTMICSPSPQPGPIGSAGNLVCTPRAWTPQDIAGYHQWVAVHSPGYVKNKLADCADFAIFLLTEYATHHNLRLDFYASFSFRAPFASRRMLNPSLHESMRRLGANDLFDQASGNTLAIPFDDLRSGDLLTSKVHIQVVLSQRSLVTVRDVVAKTVETNVPVLELVQGNLSGGKAVLVQRRAYDLRESPNGIRNDNYYEYDDVSDYYYPSGIIVDERTEFQPRRWNFQRFNSGI